MMERMIHNNTDISMGHKFTANPGKDVFLKSNGSELVGCRRGSTDLAFRGEPKSGKEEWQIEGEWVTYKKGSESKFAKSLRGRGTGWCIETESIAKRYLERGDLLVFYSNDKNNRLVNPRAVIIMVGGEVSQVRVVVNEENFYPHIADTNIIEEKLGKLPNSELWKKKLDNMKRVALLERKQKNGDEFTVDDRMFLYEIGKRIDGLDKSADPRIEEIKKNRNQRQDLAEIFECNSGQVAFGAGELNTETIAYVGSIDYKTSVIPSHLIYISGDFDVSGRKEKKLPDSLRYVGDTLRIEYNKEIEELPNDLTYIGRNFYGANSKIKGLPSSLFSSYHFLHGNFDIRNTEIEELPVNLTRIEGILSVGNTKIEKFHDGLTHVGGLSIEGSKIKETDLPANLKYRLFR